MNSLRDWIVATFDEVLLADGFDDAIIGVGQLVGQPPIAVYDIDKCIAILIEGGMSEEDAQEYFQSNTLGAWMGEGTPLFMWRPDE